MATDRCCGGMLQQINDVADQRIYGMVCHAQPQIAGIAQQRPDTTGVVIMINARA